MTSQPNNRPSTRIQGQFADVQTLAAGSRINVENKDRSQEMRQFVVSNLEAAGSGLILYVASMDAKLAVPVFPQNSITLETDSVFTLVNLPLKIDGSASATIHYVVGQLFLRLGQGPSGFDSSGGGAGSGGGGGGGGFSGPSYSGSLRVP